MKDNKNTLEEKLNAVDLTYRISMQHLEKEKETRAFYCFIIETFVISGLFIYFNHISGLKELLLAIFFSAIIAVVNIIVNVAIFEMTINKSLHDKYNIKVQQLNDIIYLYKNK